ncbi:MAG: twin transmembrane helix small protein [Ahrensia sp.]|nr:twin transmembrane helix small protein [Ahrensia sp.]
MQWTSILILVLCAIVGLVLLRGLWNMMQAGPGNTSQKLMRMRVAAQAIAVIVIVIVVIMSR